MKKKGIKINKAEIIEIIMQELIMQESRDRKIRNEILDEYETKPYYEEIVGVYDKISRAYFKMGYTICDMIKSGSQGVEIK